MDESTEYTERMDASTEYTERMDAVCHAFGWDALVANCPVSIERVRQALAVGRRYTRTGDKPHTHTHTHTREHATMEIDNGQDIIDSRDVIARIDELQTQEQDALDEIEEARTEHEEAQKALPDPQEDADDRPAYEVDPQEDADVEPDEFEEPKPTANHPETNDPYFGLDDEELGELLALCGLRDDAEGSADWTYGEALIRDGYFVEHAKQLADDIGAIDRDANWPTNRIDWDAAADDLKANYMPVDFDGEEYWIRA